ISTGPITPAGPATRLTRLARSAIANEALARVTSEPPRRRAGRRDSELGRPGGFARVEPDLRRPEGLVDSKDHAVVREHAGGPVTNQRRRKRHDEQRVRDVPN